jgi:hypothetical protein
MKTTIQLSLREQQAKKLEASILSIQETSIQLHALPFGEGIHLLHIAHSGLNTLIDFSRSKDYQILYFDMKKKFTGATYAIHETSGDFMIQTQAKWVMLVPVKHSFKTSLLNILKKFSLSYHQSESQKLETVKRLKTTFPTTPHTGIGRLYTAVRRMKVENELNIPISWRIGGAISVEPGKRSNEMKEQEWTQFYTDLYEQLKRDYPEMYGRIF